MSSESVDPSGVFLTWRAEHFPEFDGIGYEEAPAWMRNEFAAAQRAARRSRESPAASKAREVQKSEEKVDFVLANRKRFRSARGR